MIPCKISMYRIKIHRDAIADLEQISKLNPAVAAKIWAVLQEAKTNKQIQSALLDHEFGEYGSEKINVHHWNEFWYQGINLWSLKVWECQRYYPQYRVIYAFDPRDQTFYVLGVVNRDWDYRSDDVRTKRFLELYRKLDIRCI